MKACIDCGITKPLKDFPLDKGRNDGRHAYCKNCNKRRCRKYKKRNERRVKEVNRRYMEKYREDHPEAIDDWRKKNKRHLQGQAKEWRSENLGRCIKKGKEYYNSVKDDPRYKQNRKEYKKQHYQKNREKLKAKSRKWYRDNPEKARIQARVYIRRRRRDDIGFRVIEGLRNRIYCALKRGTKSDQTKKLVGCSWQKLKQHIQSQFAEGMTWGNYGEWHMDHIRPCASFDLTDPSQQRKCFNYKNLQPLWAQDNLSKGSKGGDK